MGARGERQDGRSTTEVRPIDIRMRPLPPQVHGSALFTRGETQSLATVTLGEKSMEQRYEVTYVTHVTHVTRVRGKSLERRYEVRV